MATTCPTSPNQNFPNLATSLQDLNKELRQLPIILRSKCPTLTKYATNIVAPENNQLVASIPNPTPVEVVTVVNSTQLSIPAESDEYVPSQDNNKEPNQSNYIPYFRCGNKRCDYKTTNSRPLREHLMFCELSRGSPKLICTYCRKEFIREHISKYIDHLVIHGPNLYSCALCKYKSSLTKVNYHMKMIHHFFTTYVLPVDRDKADPEQDFFVVHGKEKRKPGKKPAPKSKAKVESKTKFSPQDLDKHPPPVVTATTGIDGLDLLELKFGHFGTPLGTSFMCPRCPTSYVCKNRQEVKEHLFRDLDFRPIMCKICKIGSTMRSRMMKHINRAHNVELARISEYIEINANEELEYWVDRVLSRQQSLMPEGNKTEESRKRRRSTETVSSSSQATTPPPQAISTVTVVETSPSSQEAANYTSDEERGRKKWRRARSPSSHMYSCEYCNMTAKYEYSIVTHAKKIHPDKPPMVKTLFKTFKDAYNCMYCNCTALNRKTLNHHWMDTHKNSGLNFLFRNTVINTELDYECYWCKKRSDLKGLREHCRYEHSVYQRFLVTSLSVPKYKCSLCKFEVLFKSIDILKSHFAQNHPSEKIIYIVAESQKPVIFSHQNSPSSSSVSEKSPQLISTTTSERSFSYQCFNCSYSSPKLRLVVKHMEGHFDTFVCNECTSRFPSAVEFKSHILNKHPSSISKPTIFKGSDTDMEKAKRNIFIILKSGVRRKITEEELAEAEKESESNEENTEIYLSNGTLEENLRPPQIKETARKSTGYRLPPPKNTSPLLERIQQKSPHRFQKQLCPPDEESEVSEDIFVAVKMHGKIIRLPITTFRKLINCDPDLMLPDVI